jgi:SecD/SecF fusion protein
MALLAATGLLEERDSEGGQRAADVSDAPRPMRCTATPARGIELVYEAVPVPPHRSVSASDTDRAEQIICARMRSLGIADGAVARPSPDRISIIIPNVDNADRAQEQVGTTAQLQFYDWEPNVLGERGPDAPFAGSKGLYQAATVASKATPKAEATDLPPDGASEEVKRRLGQDKQKIQAFYDKRNDSSKEKFYLFTPDQKLIAGPDSSCKELLADFEGVTGPPRSAKDTPKEGDCRDQLAAIPVGDAKPAAQKKDAKQTSGPPAGSTILKVPQGIAVIEAERAPKQPETVQRLFVVEDDSELSGSDIKNPEQNTDQQTQEPILTMEFTDKGRKAFARVTKRIAQRGSEIILPPGTNRDAALQRFAITLDNKIVSRAMIDFRENPEGIDGRTEAQINGIGDVQETQDLAQSLRIGPLPIDLKLISRTPIGR